MPYTKSMYTDYAKDDWDIISIFKATPYKSKAKNPKPKSRVRSLTTWIPCEYEEYKYFHYVDGHTVLLKRGWKLNTRYMNWSTELSYFQ